MILSEKILALRKKLGWSQEELADKMNVSRQSISKWESAASIPDINKIIEMSKLFSVSTDYLLKDDIDAAEYIEADEPGSNKKINIETANDFLKSTARYAKQIALGVMLCILSPIVLIFLGGAMDTGLFKISEGLAGGIGLVALLCTVAVAVSIFIISSNKMTKYDYIKQGEFDLEYGVSGVISDKREKYMERYTAGIVAGVVLCILCVCPLIIAGLADASEIILIGFTDLLLAIVSVSVYIFINVGMKKACLDNLLLDGDYTKINIEANKKFERFSGIYWPAIVAAYLLVSFITKAWNITWIIWPVAALLFACLSAAFGKKE